MVVNVDKDRGGDAKTRTKNDVKSKEENEKTKLGGLCLGGGEP
jgi:hypothetical protein